MRLPNLAAVLAITAFALASCSSGESDTTRTTAPTPTTIATTTVAPATTLPPIDTATQLVDEWLAGWAAKEPDRVAAVFTDDAQYTNPTGTETFTGRDEIRTHATEYSEFILNARRVGDGVATENEEFVFRIDFDAQTKSYSGEIEVELRDDLVARMVWATYEQLN